ncbi:MAG: hypothetical protein WBB67_05320 [bacterium]
MKWNNMNGITDIMLSIVILILAIDTIRRMVAFVLPDLFSRKCFIGKIIYGTQDEEIAKRILKGLGINIEDIKRKQSYKPHSKQKDIPPLQRLVGIISRYIYKFDHPIRYGNETPILTQYYINTMGASHSPDDLIIMCHLLNGLILQHRQKSEKCYPDYVITPKTGNPILAKKFAEIEQMKSIIRKSDDDSSRVSASDKIDIKDVISINFEGFHHLITKKSEKLIGIIIDCNVSGASTIMKTIEEFNELSDKSDFKNQIEQIEEAYILFKVDNKENIDKKFGAKNLKIFRYFDLNEKIKERIYDIRGRRKQLNPLKTKDLKKINKIIDLIKQENLLRWD